MDGGNTNVGVLCADGANHRERFSVDLIPGRTNIISLKKLRREAGEAVSDDSSDENENEAEQYIFVKLPRKKSSRAIAKKSSRAIAIRENVQHNYQSRSKLHAGKSISFTSAADHELHSQSSMRTSSTKQQSEIGRNEQPCQIHPYTGHAQGTASVSLTGTPKIRNEMLHLSILQLKMLVEHSKTPLLNVQGANASSPDIEIYLSLELKEKLGNIARWTELNEGRISEELIDRLMDILGKYLERRKLKKILREMILEDLYASQAECKNFKEIKMEFVRLIRLHAPSFKAKVLAPGLTKGTYSMGDHLEDRLCDLYDTFIQGLDEDSGPSVVRRLFAKLADLFPEGTMDMHDIREAICRAKERRVLLSRQ